MIGILILFIDVGYIKRLAFNQIGTDSLYSFRSIELRGCTPFAFLKSSREELTVSVGAQHRMFENVNGILGCLWVLCKFR
jgi:hypothetical protein